MDKLEKFSRIFKITLLRWLFSKMVSNLWFLKNLQGIFHIKLKAIFFDGISFENWRRFQKKIKGISFVKMTKFFIHTRASLARAAFTLKLSLIPAIDLFFPCLNFNALQTALRTALRMPYELRYTTTRGDLTWSSYKLSKNLFPGLSSVHEGFKHLLVKEISSQSTRILSFFWIQIKGYPWHIW